MAYIDGFVIPVPPGKQGGISGDGGAGRASSSSTFGAERVVECWGDDVPHGKATDFYGAVKAEEGEEHRLRLGRLAVARGARRRKGQDDDRRTDAAAAPTRRST